MANELAIRKTIFKKELEYVFNINKVDNPTRQKLISSLFENPLDISIQFILKKDITSLDTLEKSIRDSIANDNLFGDIRSLFIIQEDLEMPIEIKDLIVSSEKVGVLVGAGISMLIGYPSWNQLAAKAIKYLNDQNLINYFERTRIMNDIIDPKQKLTIFDNLLPRNIPISEGFYKSELYKPDRGTLNAYDKLVELNCLKLTSNIDNEFFLALQRFNQSKSSEEKDFNIEKKSVSPVTEPIIVSNNFQIDSIQNNTIYHIHGHIDNLYETVFTIRDYVETYYNNKRGLREFLEFVFQEYTIIFIGYGLEEFPILEHIIKKEANKHYALVPTHLNEMNLFRLKKEYFKSLNIEAIPYFLDFNGYYRLNQVLDSWIQTVNKSRRQQYYEEVEEIDEVIN